MTKYFLVNNASRAAAYGIGTFVDQLSICIHDYFPQYELFLLDIYADVKEFTINKDEKGNLHYQVPPFLGCGNTFPYYRCILFLLSNYIEENENVIFHFNYCNHYDLMRLVKAKYKYCRILYTIHYLNWCFSMNGNLTRFRNHLNSGNETGDPLYDRTRQDYQNDRRLFSLSDYVIALSKHTRELLCQDYKIDESKIYLVYNGMKNLSNTLYSNSDNPRHEILFVGRLDEIKGVEYIIKAFKKIAKKQKEIHLVLVGEGDFGRYLANCDGMWDRITFTGKLPRARLEQFYRKATIGILPSFHEQCSYTAIEMMAYGLPFIASDSTGLGEMMDYTPECLVHIDEDNFLPADYIEQLSIKMELLLTDSNLREKSSRRLKQLFKERYRLDCMANAMQCILEKHSQLDDCISKDFLPYLDKEMIRLINKRPALDMDFVGLTGIGCYLWWRIENLKDEVNKDIVAHSMLLQEYLIYYIDWVYDVINVDGEKAFSLIFEPVPLCWVLNGLKDKGFYKTKVNVITNLIGFYGIDIKDEKRRIKISDIIWAALKIYNLNL